MFCVEGNCLVDFLELVEVLFEDYEVALVEEF